MSYLKIIEKRGGQRNIVVDVYNFKPLFRSDFSHLELKSSANGPPDKEKRKRLEQKFTLGTTKKSIHKTSAPSQRPSGVV